jgi:ADP-dependent NAD(P)H-hydrate dehydratase / NAD(P)H-hydrate epimerase
VKGRQYNRRMHPLPAGLFTAAVVRALDRRAIEQFDLPGYELMTRAGHATLNALRHRWPAARSVAVFCGPGNNGGDGYVVARIARAQGLLAHVVAVADPAGLQGDARHAFEEFAAAGGSTEPWHASSQALVAGDVVVDAIFGTGLARPVAGPAADCIDRINAANRPVVAVDIPSGLHADTGHVLGHAVRADLTVTFIGRKLGCYLADGPDHAGAIVFDDLAVPLATYDHCTPALQLLDESVVAAALPRRGRTAHKGLAGHVLVVGGAPGMGGAARLAGEAALRAGAGLVSVATHPQSLSSLAARPELMTVALTEAADLEQALHRATIVAIGPGLGQSSWSRALFDLVLASHKPLIVDADALNLLAATPARREHWVLTPHPGEAARLLQSSAAAVQRDRCAALRELQARFGGTVVLKGAGSLVQGGGGAGWLCDRGNPGMAVAGMGDVLTGVIAGIAAQCGDIELAARAGVFVHASAGDRNAQSGGERGLLASDVIEQLRVGVNP